MRFLLGSIWTFWLNITMLSHTWNCFGFGVATPQLLTLGSDTGSLGWQSPQQQHGQYIDGGASCYLGPPGKEYGALVLDLPRAFTGVFRTVPWEPTLLNKSCSNHKILADLLLKLLKLESKKWSQNFDWRPCYLVIAILSAKYPYR